MHKGYAVLYRDMKFDSNKGVTKEDILRSVNDHLESFAQNGENPAESEIYVFDKLKDAKKYANDDPFGEKEENEGFAILRVQYPDDLLVRLDVPVEGTDLTATGVDFAELTFTSAYVKHFHPAFEKLDRIKIYESGVDLLQAYAAPELLDAPIIDDVLNLEDSQLNVPDTDNKNEQEPEPVLDDIEPEVDDKKPSRLKAFFSRRNLVIAGVVALTGAALLTPMGMAAAMSFTSFVAKSAAGIYFGMTAAVLAGSIGLGLIARRLMNRKSSSEDVDPDNNEPRSDGQLSPEAMAELKDRLAERSDAANDDVSKDALDGNVSTFIPASKLDTQKSCCSSKEQNASELEDKKAAKAKM